MLTFTVCFHVKDDELHPSLIELDDALVIEDDMFDEDEDDHDDVCCLISLLL